jgi:hypothetical protein
MYKNAIILVLLLLVLFLVQRKVSCDVAKEGCCGKDNFTTTLRPISGTNVITRPVFLPGDQIQSVGWTYQVDEQPFSKQNSPWEKDGLGISPTMSGTVFRDTSYMDCKAKKGKCCPCPKGVTDKELCSYQEGY